MLLLFLSLETSEETEKFSNQILKLPSQILINLVFIWVFTPALSHCSRAKSCGCFHVGGCGRFPVLSGSEMLSTCASHI